MSDKVVVRMLTPPMCLWGILKPLQWAKLSEKEQDEWVEIAKEVHKTFDYKSLFENLNAK